MMEVNSCCDVQKSEAEMMPGKAHQWEASLQVPAEIGIWREHGLQLNNNNIIKLEEAKYELYQLSAFEHE